MHADITATIETVTGARVLNATAMGGGCVGDVYKITLAGQPPVVAKIGDTGSGLKLEGFMLRYLAQHSSLPVPAVLHDDDHLLLMAFIPGDGGLGPRPQTHAADLLAALHAITTDRFGFPCDTVIGGLAQANLWHDDWVVFFRDQRLMAMARQALDAGRLNAALMTRLTAFCDHLDRWLVSPTRASLIHGDLWTGNVISDGTRITGFVDPALSYADPEIELAFTTLFDTFSDPFFARYTEHHPINDGFFEERRDIYNLYPLLVHVRLFGAGYIAAIDRTLSRHGF